MPDQEIQGFPLAKLINVASFSKLIIKLPERTLPRIKKGGQGMERLPIEEIVKILGIDKTKVSPIFATPSDAKELEDKGDVFRDWYEEELRRFYSEQDWTYTKGQTEAAQGDFFFAAFVTNDGKLRERPVFIAGNKGNDAEDIIIWLEETTYYLRFPSKPPQRSLMK